MNDRSPSEIKKEEEYAEILSTCQEKVKVVHQNLSAISTVLPGNHPLDREIRELDKVIRYLGYLQDDDPKDG